MSQTATKKHPRTKRWKYHMQAKVVVDERPAVEGVISSISKSGILFQCHLDMPISTVVELSWNDPYAGTINGSFSIRAKSQPTSSSHCMYRARFYQVDAASKNNILSVLKNLQSLKSTSSSLDIGKIKQVITADTSVFAQVLDSQATNVPALQALLQDISPLAQTRLLQPETKLDHGLKKMQTYHLQLSLIYAFLSNTEKYAADDLNYCSSICKKLLENYIALENEELAVLKVEPTDREEDDPLDEELWAQQALQEKLVYIYKTISNAVFDLSKKLVVFLEKHQWHAKLDDVSEPQLQSCNAMAKVVVDFFHAHVEVKPDYVSDMDLVLTRSAYELENQEQVEEAQAPVDKEQKDQDQSRQLKSILLLALLVPVFLFSAWRHFVGNNVASDYRDAFAFKQLKVTRVYKNDGNLKVYIKSKNGAPLVSEMTLAGGEIVTSASEFVQKELPVVHQFLKVYPRISAVMLFDGRSKEFVIAVPRIAQ